MNRWNARLWIGAGLVLLGLLMLLERFGLFHGVTSLFWGAIFAAGAGYFLYRFVNNMQGEWWAVIPGSALLGLAATVLLSGLLPQLGGFFFLGFLGLGFFAVYYARREYWWAIIPGGVLITLGIVAGVSESLGGMETGGLTLLGFGLTFILVAVLVRAQWAWIPGIILLVLGALIGTPFMGPLNLVWPVALIAGGLLVIWRFARKQ